MTLEEAADYCQQRAAASGSSFYYSFLFLPPPRRQAITALYAFCREVDDVVDEVRDKTVAATKLAWWRTEIDRLFDGQPTHPVTIALAPHLEPFKLTRARLIEVIDGMQMDLVQDRYADFPGLALYCRRVAGVVGEMAASIFGYQDASTMAYADRLGLAFQLTNIIRDVGEDARNGRIYLPLQDLQRHGLSAASLLREPASLERSAGFQAMMAEQTQRARQTYAEAFELLPRVDWRPQRPGLIMAAIYRTLLDEIEAEDFRVMTQRIGLTPVRKLWIAWRTYMRAAPPSQP